MQNFGALGAPPPEPPNSPPIANFWLRAWSSLIYIAGYVQKKGGVVKENDLLFHYHKFGKYVDALNRGSLSLPQDYLVQWCIFCVIFFPQVLDAGCRKYFVDRFFKISVRYNFCVSKKNTALFCAIYC